MKKWNKNSNWGKGHNDLCRLQHSPRQATQRQEDQVQKSMATIQVILVEFYLDENFDDNLDDNVDDNLDDNLDDM